MASLKISNKQFVHCHVHSEYSQFDGCCKLSALVSKARKMGFPAIALTDHGNVAGWVKFIQACMATKDKNGQAIPEPTIKPLLGSEMYLSRDRHLHAGQGAGGPDNRHLILIAKDWEGYKNVSRLSHASWTEGFYAKPRVDFDLLSKHSAGVIASSACISGLINTNLLHDRYGAARQAAGLLKDIYGDDLYLELMFQGLAIQRIIAADILKLGKELGITVIATNDVHYLERDQALSQEVLMCMSSNKCIHDESHVHHPHPDFYLKSAQEMAEVFEFCPQVLYNTIELAEKVNFESIHSNLFGGMRLPTFDVPEQFKTPYEFLTHLAETGLRSLNWDKSPQHVEALRIELDDINVAFTSNNYDFATYFLIVWDYIKYAKEKKIFCGPGRGSGYGSIVLRCLGVTYGPDPLEYGLLWERFLGFDTKRFILERDFGFPEY